MKQIIYFLIICTFLLVSCKKENESDKKQYGVSIAVVEQRKVTNVMPGGDTVITWELNNHSEFQMNSAEHDNLYFTEYPCSLYVERVNNYDFQFKYTDFRDWCGLRDIYILTAVDTFLKWSDYVETDCGRTKIGVAIRKLKYY